MYIIEMVFYLFCFFKSKNQPDCQKLIIYVSRMNKKKRLEVGSLNVGFCSRMGCFIFSGIQKDEERKSEGGRVKHSKIDQFKARATDF